MKRIYTATLVSGCLLIAGCSPGVSDQTSVGKQVNIQQVNGETVAVVERNTSSRAYADLASFVAATPIIVEGTLRSTKTIANERIPSTSEEGVVEGEGADLYGTATFDVTSVIKGDPNLTELTVTFNSGKRDSTDKKKRIAYMDENYSEIQLSNGELAPANQFTNRKFVVFAAPNRGYLPFGSYVVGVTNGIASVESDGTLKFGSPSKAPLTSAEANITTSRVREVAHK